MSAHFTSHYLAEIIRDLYFEESTGVIAVRHPDSRRIRLHFDRGMLYFAEGADREDSFEASLEASGVASRAVLSRAKDGTSSAIEFAARISSPDSVSKEAIAPLIRELVERCVCRAFSWPGGTYEFEPQQATPGFFDPDVLFTFECILAGIRSMAHFGPLKEVLLKLPGRARLTESVFLPVHKLALKPHDGYILSRIDGTMRLQEIATLLPPGEEDESLQFVYGLAVLGIVEFVPPVNQGLFSLREVMQSHHQSSARESREVHFIKEFVDKIMGQRPFEVLGVAPDDDPAHVREVFDRARAMFDRDRFTARTREEHKKELGLIENKLTEAFLKLQVERLERSRRRAAGDPTLVEIDAQGAFVRPEVVRSDAQKEEARQAKSLSVAENYLQKAKEFYVEKKYHDCIEFCKRALELNSSMASAHALMADALVKNPHLRWQKMAADAYQRAVELDPASPEIQVSLGLFYRAQGLEIRARRHFEKALEIAPSHEGAKAALRNPKRPGNAPN